MKIFLLLLALLFLASAVPTRVRSVDVAEYAIYKAWCAKVVSKRVEQFGKITLLKKEGYYTNPAGTFTRSTKATYWYSLSTKTFTVAENEKLVSRYVIVNEANDATPTIKEFYTIWMPAKYNAEIKRLEAAIADTLYVYHVDRLKKQLEYTKIELTKIQ